MFYLKDEFEINTFETLEGLQDFIQAASDETPSGGYPCRITQIYDDVTGKEYGCSWSVVVVEI